jgi:hypothetical protein
MMRQPLKSFYEDRQVGSPIDGAGESAITEAMLAIARHLGYSKAHIV